MTTTPKRRRTSRASARDLSVNRDLYAETCAELGFDPLPPIGLDWGAVFTPARKTLEEGWKALAGGS